MRKAADSLIRNLARTESRVKWVKPDSLHITLKFLGEVGEDLLPEIQERLTRVCRDMGPFPLVAEGVGAFPKRRSPQVIWMGLSGETDRMARLAKDLEGALAPLGFEPEKRGFKPHITLGRMRRSRRGAPPAGQNELAEALLSLAAFKGPSFLAERVTLMKSTLTPKGAIYEPVFKKTLV